MQYSDTTNNTGLIQYIEKRTGLGFTTISGDDNKLKEFTLYSNNGLSKIWSAIFSVSESWQYDDSNYETLPQATTDLVSGQSQYALLTEALTIKRVEVMDESGNYNVIHPVSLEEIPSAVDEYYEDNAQPFKYRLVNGTIELFPASNYSQNNGIKIYFDRASVSFSYDDTTQSPGFASEFHYLVGVWAEYEWKSINMPSEASIPLSMFKDGIEELKNVLKKRFKQKRKKLTVYKKRMI